MVNVKIKINKTFTSAYFHIKFGICCMYSNTFAIFCSKNKTFLWYTVHIKVKVTTKINFYALNQGKRIFAEIGRKRTSVWVTISRSWRTDPTPISPSTPTAMAYSSTFNSILIPAAIWNTQRDNYITCSKHRFETCHNLINTLLISMMTL